KIEPLIAIGDPAVAEITVLNPRQVRVTGLRMGVTDLAITTAEGQVYSFEVRVIADLDVLRAKLRCLFPDAYLKLGALRDHVVVEGQARDVPQVARILETVRAYLYSVQIAQARQIRSAGPVAGPVGPVMPRDPDVPPVPGAVRPDGLAAPERGPALQIQGT